MCVLLLRHRHATIRRCSDTQLVALLWAVSHLRRRPGGPWLSSLAAALAARADQLRPAQIARAVTAMAKMRTAMPYKVPYSHAHCVHGLVLVCYLEELPP